jgi:hypothetical protein
MLVLILIVYIPFYRNCFFFCLKFSGEDDSAQGGRIEAYHISINNIMNGNIFEIFFRTLHIQPKVSAIKVQSHLIFFFNDGEYFQLLGGILFIILISYLTSYFIFTVGLNLSI